MGWLEQQREKQKREAQSRKLTSKFARGLDTPSGNPFGRWAQGVAQRTMHPLETLAGVAQQSLDDPMGTALNWSNPIAGGMVGMFAGKGAKTANLAALTLAEQLKAKGVPDADIWKQTGWTLDTPDKLPRFEIPDNAAIAQFTHLPEYGSERIAQRAVEHPELFAAYPDATGITQLGMRDASDVGSMDALGNFLTAKAPNEQGLKSVGIHELQHAIQQREGFARGGSPTDAVNLRDEILPTIQNLQSRINDIRTGKVQGSFDELMQLENELKPLNQQYDVLARENAFDTYKRLAGEAEARLTQARMNMTPEQRLAQYPYEPQYFQQATGVPLRDLIVRTQ